MLRNPYLQDFKQSSDRSSMIPKQPPSSISGLVVIFVIHGGSQQDVACSDRTVTAPAMLAATKDLPDI